MAHFPDTPSFTGFNTPSRIEADIGCGGLKEAFLRGVIYIFQARGEADERHFRHAWEFATARRRSLGQAPPSTDDFRVLARRQALLMAHNTEAALAAA